MLGIVGGVQSQFITAAKTIVGVNRLDVECEEFSFLTSDDEGQGGVGAENIPEDVAKKSKYGSESIKGEMKKRMPIIQFLVLV